MTLRIPGPLYLFLLTIALVLVGLGLRSGYPIYRQQMAIREIRRLGGDARVTLNGPDWLRDRVAKRIRDIVGHIWVVELGTPQVTDADLAALRDCPQVELLSLAHSRITDAGLVQLAGLEHLDSLNLAGTAITSAGLEHLAGFRQLQYLNVVGTGAPRDVMNRLGARVPYVVAGFDDPNLDRFSYALEPRRLFGVEPEE
jgi:hypothetical protein